MPKLKTKSGAKKRFKVTATGKVMAAQRGKRHGMIKRTKKQIRQLRHPRAVQDRWRQHQKILLAERLIASAVHFSRAASARPFSHPFSDEGDPSWLASNAV
jgi:large subunit ribosomal protein L35